MSKTTAILIARLIFAFVFGMAAAFKFAFIGIDATATEIAGAGFPIPHLLAWVAAFFEVGLALAFLTGAYFVEAAIVSVAYVLFLAFSSTVRTAGAVIRWSSDSSSTTSRSSPDSCSLPSTALGTSLSCGGAQSDQQGRKT